MGSRAKNNPPRRRGPKPERLVLPAPWIGRAPMQGPKKSKESWPRNGGGGKKRKSRGK
ncbi:MAG TPA: hypothetical protein VIG08_17090 [Gemmatimonadales bacterium]